MFFKMFLNGDLVAKGPGNGYLSQDWTGKAGIGMLSIFSSNRYLAIAEKSQKSGNSLRYELFYKEYAVSSLVVLPKYIG